MNPFTPENPHSPGTAGFANESEPTTSVFQPGKPVATQQLTGEATSTRPMKRLRTKTTSTALPVDAKDDGNGSDFEPKEILESPGNQPNVLSDDQAAGPAFTTDATPGHPEQSTVADVDMYDMDEDYDPSEAEAEYEYVEVYPRWHVRQMPDGRTVLALGYFAGPDRQAAAS